MCVGEYCWSYLLIIFNFLRLVVSELSSLWFFVTQAVLGMGSFLWSEWTLSHQTLVGYAHRFCAAIALAYFAVRMSGMSRVLWLVGVLFCLLVACS